MRSGVSYRKKTVKTTNTCSLNNTLLHNPEVAEEIKVEIEKYLETNDKENTTPQKPMGCSKSSSNREVYRHTRLPQELRKISNKQFNPTPKTTRKIKEMKPQI